ncbi:hypothetical protein [Croceimicrobium sp.]|uniref:hypothetical protein n=1 Tax=Croceimicrobium sp. TaxID=2828340 RepID=UPI003BABC6E1
MALNFQYRILKSLLSLLLLSQSLSLLACDCIPIKNREKALSREYSISNAVFIGEVLSFSADSSSFEIRVVEVIKGDLSKGQIIKGINEGLCGPFVSKSGAWIFLGNYDQHFKANDCGLSLSLKHPWNILPPPPPEISAENPNWEDSNCKFDQIREWKNKAKKEAEKQVSYLKSLD